MVPWARRERNPDRPSVASSPIPEQDPSRLEAQILLFVSEEERMGMPRRSRIAAFVLIALGCPALAAAKTWTFSWDSRPVEIREGADGYAEITIEHGISSAEVGAPDLPWIHASIDLAPGQVVTSWRFMPDEPRVLQENVRPRPVQTEPNSLNPEPPFVEMDPSYLASAYPAEPAIFQGMRSTRGEMSAG